MEAPKNPLSPLRLRRLLGGVMRTDAELDAFCLDYHPEVARRFTEGMDRTTKVNLLLMLVSPVELLNRLRTAYPDAEAVAQRVQSGEAAARSSGETPSVRSAEKGAARLAVVRR